MILRASSLTNGLAKQHSLSLGLIFVHIFLVGNMATSLLMSSNITFNILLNHQYVVRLMFTGTVFQVHAYNFALKLKPIVLLCYSSSLGRSKLCYLFTSYLERILRLLAPEMGQVGTTINCRGDLETTFQALLASVGSYARNWTQARKK